MTKISETTTFEEFAAIVSNALERAGIVATLSGGGAVTIYSGNQYESADLDFVTSTMVDDLEPVLAGLGFMRTGSRRLAQFEHPKVDWYLDFPSSPLAFGNTHVSDNECLVISLPKGRLRIISPTQSVMDRLAAAFAWKDEQSREQAILVAAKNEIDWDELESWFKSEGESAREFRRFRDAVESSDLFGKTSSNSSTDTPS